MINYKVFDDNLFLLEKIFGKEEVLQKLERLKFIYKNTEESWFKNLEYFQDSEVKYILICEAPPYSGAGIPVFFYNQTNSSFHRTIWKTFFTEDIKDFSQTEIYQKIAARGFLLIDNIPFSMKYFTRHRKKEAYFQLIKNSLEWTLEKLNLVKTKISNDVKIAFGFKINALQFIRATNGNIMLTDKIINFGESNISANGSGFPSSNKLKNIFSDDLQNYLYYNGEIENPYCNIDESPLNFQNPKALFWHYENHYYFSQDSQHQDLKSFIKHLIDNKLSEYHRNTDELQEMYYNNSIK